MAIELATGTFYLLMVALGMVAAALAAHLNLDQTTQIVLAAFVGLGALMGLYVRRKLVRGRPRSKSKGSANDLDVGQTVLIQTEQLSDQGATVHYRGTNWLAQSVTGLALSAGWHRIVKVEGPRLLLEPV